MTFPDHRIADGSSRAAVLKVLRERGDLVKVEELAEAVSLSLSAVRFHLERLIADGLVRTAKEPRATPGRPRVMYLAVPEEAVDDAAAYRHLAALLADQLSDRGGAGAAEAAGRVWAEQVTAAAVERRPTDPRIDPGALPGRVPDSLAGVLAVLEDGGFAPRLRDDGWTIELHRCPFAELMPEQSEMVCAVHRGLVRAIPELNGDRIPAVLFPVPDVEAPCVVRFRRDASTGT
ncbi:MAG TPA: winged helix-turn-helix transcriptional regulator [Kineosporiaceae bacterium]